MDEPVFSLGESLRPRLRKKHKGYVGYVVGQEHPGDLKAGFDGRRVAELQKELEIERDLREKAEELARLSIATFAYKGIPLPAGLADWWRDQPENVERQVVKMLSSLSQEELGTLKQYIERKCTLPDELVDDELFDEE
jgi:hypothetical protein